MSIGPLEEGLSPQARQLVIRAVAKFSDACEAPELTPECPFMEYTKDGLPACAEECQDLIAEYPDDLIDPTIAVGPGLAARARRPRRGPDKNSPAYDAREQLLVDSSKPIGEWRIGALLTVVRNIAYAPKRELTGSATAPEVIAEIERRGLDATGGLRWALARDRALSINFLLLLRGSIASADSNTDVDRLQSIVADMTSDPGGWELALRSIDAVTDDASPFVLNEKGVEAICTWLAAMPLDQLLADVVPSRDDLVAAMATGVENELLRDGRWLLERFTSTFVEEWSESSLREEWQFAMTRRRGCAVPSVMRQRAIEASVVARAIADLHCDAEEDETEQGWTPSHFKTLALQRLGEGRTEAAAGIYKVLHDMRPKDSEILNNLGFCLIPNAPSEALEYLRGAVDNGPEDAAITNLNIALALHLLGGNAEAVAVGMAAVADCERDHTAFMWEIGDQVLAFEHVDDLANYGDRLLDHFANCDGKCITTGPTLIA